MATCKPKGPTEADVREIVDALTSGRRIQWAATRTEAFRRWFGDSRVVDGSGRPLVVYHGTTAGPFDAFRPFYRKGEDLGFGIHFAEDVEFAAGYAFDESVARKGKEPRLIAAFLSVQNVLNADAIVLEGSREFALAKKCWTVNFFAPQNEHGVRGVWLQGAINRASDPKRAERLIRDAGYDGVRYKATLKTHTAYGARHGAESVSWVVFRAGQVKSATDNSGAYDGEREAMVNGRGARGRRGR